MRNPFQPYSDPYPEQPGDDPNAPAERMKLEDKSKVPHEVGGALRILRRGYIGERLAAILGVPVGPQLQAAIKRDLDLEQEANRAGRELKDGAIPRNYK